MPKKPERSRSQTLSLRMKPSMRFALERSSIFFRQSMTDVIERSVSLAIQAEIFDLPECVRPLENEKTITLQRVINLTWSDNEIIRLLRMGIVAPALLSTEEAHVVVVFFNIVPFSIGDKTKDNFWGASDPFEGVQMSDSYYKNWPRFDLEKCGKYLDSIKEASEFSTIDLGLVFRGGLGDIRRIKSIPAPV
ncbi:hypothetical protein [Pseudomonas psychrophila]|uniref:hypothetical protein n=1 Tax=Pseudomonas psychrophila TaxID=122355 RepID=UPI0005270C6A|nr:hypothetical protein [Pseudomonas psychrophila]